MSEKDVERIVFEISRDIIVLKEKMGYMEDRVRAMCNVVESLKTDPKEWR